MKNLHNYSVPHYQARSPPNKVFCRLDLYKNNINKAAAFAVGAGSSFFTIYGLVIPPLYATAVGAFTPKMNLSDLSDSPYINDTYYCEGYQKKMRDRKIRNALVSGLAGFAAGFITLTLVK
mgnify:CR=1 FL=1